MKKIEELTTKQKIMVIGLLLICITVLAIPFFNDDIYFKKTIITYGNGCNETYLDGKIVTPECPKSDSYEQWLPTTNFTLNLSYD